MRWIWIILLAIPLLRGAEPPDEDKAAIALEALKRLQGIDLESNPTVKSAVLKVLDSIQGTAAFVEIVRDFKIADREPELIRIALTHPDPGVGAGALRLVLDNQRPDLIRAELASTNAVAMARALGNTGRNEAVPLLEPIVKDPQRPVELRKTAVRALAQIRDGARLLLELARTGSLLPDLTLAAGMELRHVPWPELKEEALKLLPPPQTANAEPLPPISELIQRTGDPAIGAEVFAREAVACITCHQVNGQGVDFGPNLSEIGSKLGKDALYESILNPSAGISFGYEGWQIELKDGEEAFGIIVSETADEIAVKAQTGIVTRFKKDQIVKREKMKLSIMPAGLQETMSTDDLVHLVEYLASLKKSGHSADASP